MSQISPLELEHCNELAISPGSVFEFTSRFIPTVHQQQLVALYALIQSIGSIPIATTDDLVKWAKLKWWSEELMAEPDAPSRHPVLRAIWQSGARRHWDNGLLLRLVSDAAKQIDPAPDADENAMFERLAESAETGILLELALEEAVIESSTLNRLAAASGLHTMISGFSTHRQAVKLRLPLNLLAEYQLTETQLVKDPPDAELVAVITRLADSGVDWFSKGLSDLGALPCMHLSLRWTMEARLLARLSKNAGAHLRRSNRFGFSDAWFAWRFCRGFEPKMEVKEEIPE